ncbi:MAG: hypothetical protein RL264_2149 [Bacteroidota bacterium]
MFRLIVIFLGILFIVGSLIRCKSAKAGYTNAALRVRQREIYEERMRQQKFLEKKFKRHRKNQAPATRRKMKKELKAMRREIKRKKRQYG